MEHGNEYANPYTRLLAGFIILLFVPAYAVLSGCEKKVEHRKEPSHPPDYSTIPDFSSIKNVKEKKKRFFSFMRPLIKAENARIRKKREQLLTLYEKHGKGEKLAQSEKEWLNRLIKKYRIYRGDIENEKVWEKLLKRVDIVPLDLALIQAAKESGWGTSRFARSGYNMYGQRCFKDGCGIVPGKREEGKNHEVETFKSVEDSVRSYIHNLNTSSAYKVFREMRYAQRKSGNTLDGYKLVSGLPLYSERRDAYLEELRQMITENREHIGT